MRFRSNKSYSPMLGYIVIGLFIFVPYREVLGNVISPKVKALPDIIIAALLMYNLFANKLYKKLNYIDIIYASFIAAGLISTLYNGVGIKAFILEARSITLYYFLYFMIRNIRVDDNFKYILRRVLIINTTVLVLLGVIEKLWDKKLLFPVKWALALESSANFPRVYGMFNNPNTFGAYLVLTLIVVLTIDRALRKPTLWFYSLVVGGLLLTVSRSAIIALALAVVVIIPLINNNRFRISIILSLVIGGIIFSGVSFAHNQFGSGGGDILSKRINELGSDKIIEQSAEGGRIFSVMTGLKVFKDHKLLGTGFGTYGDAASLMLGSPIYKEYSIPDNFYSDNEYIKILAETGIIGSILYVALIISLIFESLRGRNPYMIAVTTSILFLGMFFNIFEIQIISLFYWVMMGYKEELVEV